LRWHPPQHLSAIFRSRPQRPRSANRAAWR
jgi:hypothetical protein